MVQFTDYTQFGTTFRDFDLYWKLDNCFWYDSATLRRMLKEEAFPHKVTTPRERLKELYARSQRGCISYEMQSLPELKRRIDERGLSIPVDQKYASWSFRAILERADDNATFHRFTDLQPELRLQIYNHHFNSFTATDAYIMSQPPITGVRKSVREESLPQFYGCCLFKATLFPYSSALKYSLGTDRLLERTTAEQFGWIRNIKVKLHLKGFELALAIDICNKRDPIKISHCQDGGMEPSPLTEESVDDLSSELDVFVRNIAARDGDCKLQKLDLESLHQIVRSILAQHGYSMPDSQSW